MPRTYTEDQLVEQPAMRRVQPADVAYLRAIEGTLSEWKTAEDEKAYRDL
jgi:hypothetical protein